MSHDAFDWPALWQLATDGFALGPTSIHGPAHWRAVERNAIDFAAFSGADVTLVRLFAVLHDSQRRNESHDPGHGPRAAAWAATLALGLDDVRLATLAHALRDHDRGTTSDDPTIGTCWDADRLDLTRVGMRPDPAYFSTAEGRRRAAIGWPIVR